jgi:hypothetical protein
MTARLTLPPIALLTLTSESDLEYSMLEKHLSYDPAALRAAHDQRHGRVLGEIVFNAAVHRRQLEDQRYADLTAELLALQETISAHAQSSSVRRAKSRQALNAEYAAYKTMCEANARLDEAEQSALAPLTARSLEIQTAMRDIALPRVGEREMQELAIRTSTNADLLRNLEKTPSTSEAPPLSTLARINLTAGLHKPRS